MYLSVRNHEVGVVDNFAKRVWELELDIEPLIPIRTLPERLRAWHQVTGRRISSFVGDLADYEFVRTVVREFQPQAIVHYGEQPSAPFSMMNQQRCVMTQVNNISATLNVLWAIRQEAPDAHLVKLGTMGEYGTPNIDIEEGFIEIEYKGRKDTVPYPKQPGSFYHLSKVHDSHNLFFTTKIWKLRTTDLNQGIVYGVATEESEFDPRLVTSFHYDEVFGTTLNRFCAQAVLGVPLTVYGRGTQKRGFLNIRDTLRCVELSILTPAEPGHYRVFNQFTQMFSIQQLAETVGHSAQRKGFSVSIDHIPNPRVESEEHYYNPRHQKLLDLGLKPQLLSDTLVTSIFDTLARYVDRIRCALIMPKIGWNSNYVAPTRDLSSETTGDLPVLGHARAIASPLN
jgi:UDP-sulfoquinovose synthase